MSYKLEGFIYIKALCFVNRCCEQELSTDFPWFPGSKMAMNLQNLFQEKRNNKAIFI